jgi:hypothetical protein
MKPKFKSGIANRCITEESSDFVISSNIILKVYSGSWCVKRILEYPSNDSELKFNKSIEYSKNCIKVAIVIKIIKAIITVNPSLK